MTSKTEQNIPKGKDFFSQKYIIFCPFYFSSICHAWGGPHGDKINGKLKLLLKTKTVSIVKQILKVCIRSFRYLIWCFC